MSDVGCRMSEARPALADFPPQVAWPVKAREQRELPVPLGGRCCRRGDTRWSLFADRLLPAGRCSLTAADVFHHIRLAHNATATGACHVGQVHSFVSGESACARRSTRCLPCCGKGSRSWRRRRRRLGKRQALAVQLRVARPTCLRPFRPTRPTPRPARRRRLPSARA
jgi:hypothetical protein